jgi:divalent metal cation (Fe/Co/Zn/Cd) transporter
MDLATGSAGVLLALGAVYVTGIKWLDPLCAGVVGLYLIWTAIGLLRKSTAGLMDEQDAADDDAIRSLLELHVSGEKLPKICSYEKLRHRHAGRMHWVDFHMRVPRNMTVFESHRIACAIEAEIEAGLGEADATAHVEPCAGCGVCLGAPTA